MNKFTRMRSMDPSGFYGSVKRTIEQITEVSVDHLTPELALRLVTPNCEMWKAKYEECPFPDPFWAFYWPGGQALTRYLLDNKSAIKGKSVLDVGSGCGSIAIAAAKLGNAVSVTANDIDPIAAVAIEMNASLNLCKQGEINIITDNIIGKSDTAEKYDCILLGDMFYDDSFMKQLMDWLLQLLSDGTQVLIGDPGRNVNFFERYKSNLDKVAKYSNVNDHMKINGLASNDINVWRLIDKIKSKNN